MERLELGTTQRGASDRFTGDVWFDAIARGEDVSRLRASIVRFAPGARSAWHSHSLGQTLYVTEGTGLVVTRTRVIVMAMGESVHTPPGEEHWHGALPEQFMTHLGMWEDDDFAWGELVTDAEYLIAAGQA